MFTYLTVDEAVSALTRKEADAVVPDKNLADSYVKEDKTIKSLSLLFFTERYCVAVKN